MTTVLKLVKDDSDSRNLCSEQHIVREVSSHTSSAFALPMPNESLSYGSNYDANPHPELLRVWGPSDLSVWFDFPDVPATPQVEPQPVVLESLQRSLVENADVWEELSKY